MAEIVKPIDSPEKARILTRRYLPVGLSLMVGLGLSAIATAIVWYWEGTTTEASFAQRADNLTVALQSQIDQYLQVTSALGALYDASENVRSEEFKAFATPFLQKYPGILGMAWLQRVPGKERADFEAQMQAEGLENYQIHQRHPSGKLVPATERSDYFPIIYGEPKTLYKPEFIGFDPSFNPAILQAIYSARDSGLVRTTERFLLANSDTYGFAIFRPVYRHNIDLTPIAQRREVFIGVTYTIYRLSEMLERTLRDLNLQNFNFYLIDNLADNENRLLVFYDATQDKFNTDKSLSENKELFKSSLCSPNFRECLRKIEVADREWTLAFRPTGKFIPSVGSETLLTLAIGVVLTAAVAISLGLSIRRTTDLEVAMQQLQDAQSQLIQAEKMSSIGQLVAGVAHEINNPVSFIYGNITHADEYIHDLLYLLKLYEKNYPEPVDEIQSEAEALDLAFILEDLPKTLTSMKVGAERIQKIVLNLRNFSRMDEADLKTVNIHEGIDSTLMILQHRLKATTEHPEIVTIKKYGNLPPVECYPGQLNQVFMNLLANAIDALEIVRRKEGGVRGEENTSHSSLLTPYSSPTIRIHTEVKGNSAIVRIADNGIGIPLEVREKIFNPFFTTKPIGKGTGLGLSISYQIIVEKHQGVLRCFSEPDKGTEFYIEIPIFQQKIKIAR